MADFTIYDEGFSATTVTVEPSSDRGREAFEQIFGRGAVSAELRKSGSFDFIEEVEGYRDLTVSFLMR